MTGDPSDPFAGLKFGLAVQLLDADRLGADRIDALRQRLDLIERQWLTGMWDLSKRIHDLEAALITVKTCMEAMLELLRKEYGDGDGG